MWIEITANCRTTPSTRSRPARALWIEIILFDIASLVFVVEAREGLVD